MKITFLAITATVFALGLAIAVQAKYDPPKKPAAKMEISPQPVKLELSPQPGQVQLVPQPVKLEHQSTSPEKSKDPEKPAANDVVYQWMVRIFVIIIAGFIGLLGFAILWFIFFAKPPYKINLSLLISEKDGQASMSRFQLLIFTFVISSSLFIMSVCKLKFPEVNNDILWLLGISSGSYVGAKGIQVVKDVKTFSKSQPPTAPSEDNKPAAPEG
jgi:hypothetical protein